MPDQGVPHALAHRGSAGRHFRRAGQHGRGRLALPFLRHHQGVGLAGRPGRDRIHVPRSDSGDRGAGTLRRAVQPHRGRQDLPAPVRRHDHQVRRRPTSAAHLRRRRPHRPRHAAYAVPAVVEARRALHDRILRPGSDLRRGRRVPRRAGAGYGRRLAASIPRARRGAGHRRLRSRVFQRYFRAHLHRRRRRFGAARWFAAAGHGIRPVPPHRHLRRGLPDHRRRTRRRRHPAQQQWRTLHGTLCAALQGPGFARCGVAFDDGRNPRRPRRGRAQGSHSARPDPLGSGSHQREVARHRRKRAYLRGRGRDQTADPGAAHRALQHGRHSHQLPRRSGAQGRR